MAAAKLVGISLIMVKCRTDHAAVKHVPVFVELEVEVQAAHVIEVGGKLAVGVDEADGRVLAYVVGHSPHGEVCALAEERVAWQHALAGRPVVRNQESHGPGALLAGEARAELWIGDPAGK